MMNDSLSERHGYLIFAHIQGPALLADLFAAYRVALDLISPLLNFFCYSSLFLGAVLPCLRFLLCGNRPYGLISL